MLLARRIRPFVVVVLVLVASCSGEATDGPGQGGSTDTTATTVDASASTVTAGATTTAASGLGGGAPAPPDFDALPWQTGDDVGFGVAMKDSENPLGSSVFIGYAGYDIPLDAAEAWVTALYHASLRDRGVRRVYAVQGPADAAYSGLEIGNSKIAAALVSEVDADTRFILVAGHSSGSFVAHELLGQLAGELDPGGVTADRVVYFDLDGGGGLSSAAAQRLRRAYFVGAFDAATSTSSPNRSDMQSLGAAHADLGGFFDIDASPAGCLAGANWCLHMTLVTTQPHDKSNADGVPDYSDFEGRPVSHAWLDMRAAEAGLDP